MRRLFAAAVVIGIGLALAGCSKCDFPVYRTGACQSDTPPR